MISETEFDNMLEQQNQTKKWRELEEGKIYVIAGFKEINTEYGEAMILYIEDFGEVWAPSHLAKKIQGESTPIFVRPTGEKRSQKNKKNKYYSYDLVIPN